MSSAKVKRLVNGALMAAIVFVATWLVRVPVPLAGGGYVNFGDAAILMCAFIAGGPMAAAAAAVGSALADLAAGAVIYIVPTMFIKAGLALVAGWTMRDHAFKGYLAGTFAGGAVMVAGYFMFEGLFFDWAFAVASLPYNLLQWAGSTVAALALFEAVRRIFTQIHRSGLQD